MPVTLVDRLPLPNLKVYTAGSVLLLSVAVYFAVNVTSDPNWRANATLQRQEPGAGSAEGNAAKMVQQLDAPTELLNNATKNVTDQFIEVMTFMMQEPLCMWTLINMAYCLLAVFGCFIQRLVFGKLRVAEAQRVKDKFWNYVFYKFIFVFGVLNVQYMDEVLLWCSWFTLIGFLHLLGQLCKDRFDYVSVDPQLTSSPSAAWWAHTRLLCLLVGILAASMCLFGAAVAWGLPAGKDTFAFMAAECLLVAIATLHVLARFFLRVQEADAAGPASYYTHLIFDAAGLVTETCHVAHMVVYSNVVVSMASVVLLMQLRHLLHALLARLRRHRLYSALATHMSRNYPMASAEEVRKNEDNCAICWEPMKEARKLPCAHLFHNSCLCRWVQQDASCPTCRRALSAAPDAPARPPAPHAPHAPRARPGLQGGPDNHLFHFDGSRYVSWLPSFSVEVTRVRDAANARAAAGLPRGLPGLPGGLPGSQTGGLTGGLAVESMVRQVQQLFPQMPHSVLAADLALTRSPDTTIDNILEGRLLAPPPDAPLDTSAMAGSIVASTAATTTLATSAADETQETNSENAIQFSQSAPERETLLRRRKDALLATARRRYLERVAAHAAHAAHTAQPAQSAQSAQSARTAQSAQSALPAPPAAQPAHVARS